MTQLNLAYLNEKIERLETKCERLEHQQNWMNKIFQAYGISGSWVSPNQAADLLCVSREGVMWHVRRAERFRELKMKCECEFGIHYRQAPRTKDDASDNPYWQIHVGNFEKLLAIPHDTLKAC